MRCLSLYFICCGEMDNCKASLSAMAVSYPDVYEFCTEIQTKLVTKVSTYVQDGGFKITNNNNNTNSGFTWLNLVDLFIR